MSHRSNWPDRVEIILGRDPQGQEQAILLEEGRAVEWLRHTDPGLAVRQDIVLGRVESIAPALQAAFVSIGLAENGLLRLKDAPPGIRPGQPIVVQIRRMAAPGSGKGPLLTTTLQFPGWFVVHEPTAERPILRSKARALESAEREPLVALETEALRQQAALVFKASTEPGPLPRLLHRPQSPLVSALRDWTGQHVQTIWAGDLELFKWAESEIRLHWPALLPRLRLASGPFSVTTVFRLDDMPQIASRRKILLDNGGSVIFDPTEALLSVDVNSGQADASSTAQLRLKTNLLAAAEIARQIRLRQVSGLVVVDFIRLADDAARESLAQAFANALSHDRSRIVIGGFTRLGLFEIIRQTP
jgi:Ribonuclease G/E